MKKFKIWVLVFSILVVVFGFSVESISTSGYMKISLKNGNVFYGKICHEGQNDVMIELGSILINFKKNEIDFMIPVETLPHKEEDKAKSIVMSKSAHKKDNIEDFIKSLGRQYHIDPDLIKAVIKVESNFDRFATSHKGAKGLMQLMPQTAQFFGVFDVYNPYQNIEGGVKFLRAQLNEFDEDIRLALAAYNAGPKKVKRYKGIPPFPETKRFIEKVLRFYNYFKKGGDIIAPGKIIYAFKDKKGNFIITDIPPSEALQIYE